MRDLLLTPLGYQFFQRALIAGIVIGALCGAMSVPVTLRRMSYIGHGLAHSVIGGVAVGVALGINLYAGAIFATVVAALLIDRVARREGVHIDAAIGIVTTAAFALGIVVLALVPSRVNLEAVLFGNLLGVTTEDLMLALSVTAVTAVILFAGYKRGIFTLFDEDVARAHGINVNATILTLNLLTAAVVVASVRVLGALLIAAAIVLPAATARLVTRRFARFSLLAIAIGTLTAIIGLYASFHLDIPSGPAVVLAGTLFFTLAYVSALRSAATVTP
jgi:manganese/iron transport system permease protein/iron/zinc/copper transport system permease protein